jgi:hypothetical protein
VQEVFDLKAANINPQDSSNPYNITSINSLAEQSPTVANLPIYQKVFATRAKAGEQLTDPSKIFSAGIDALASKKITFPEFLELSTIYQVGVNNNLAQRNMQGIAGITPKLSYKTNVVVSPSNFVSSKIVDLTRPDDLARAAMTALKTRVAPIVPSGLIGD